MRTRSRWAIAVVMVVGLACLSGCLLRTDGEGGSGATSAADGSFGHSATATVPAGTPLAVRLTTRLSSETAHVGDAWSGAMVNSVSIGSWEVIPAGSSVRGVVTAVHMAARGSHAIIDLVVQDVAVAGRTHDLSAITEPLVAGSPRARNLGAIAAGASPGALIGSAIGGDGNDAAVGSLVGGAAATGLVAASQGYQMILKPGTVVMFTVSG